jgi:hypothetical protein
MRTQARKIDHDEERKLADDARLLRDWLAWHREQRKAVPTADPHGPMFERLVYIPVALELKSTMVLLAFVRGVDWTTIATQTCLIILHNINSAITNVRTRLGLPPFDEGWPEGRQSALSALFCFPRTRRRPGRSPV